MSITFFKLDAAVARDQDIKAPALRLYVLMLSLANIRTRKKAIYIADIARRYHRSVRTVQRWMKYLCEWGLIKREDHKRKGDPRWNEKTVFTVCGNDAIRYAVQDSYSIQMSVEHQGIIESQPWNENRPDEICTENSDHHCRRQKLSPGGDIQRHPNNSSESFKESILNTLKRDMGSPLQEYAKKPIKEIPTKDTIPVPEKTPKGKTAPASTQSTASAQTTFIPDQGETLSDVPEVMRPTVRYFLYRTGRKTFTQKDIEALKSVAQTHTPARIQKEIDVAVERFIRYNRKLPNMAFAYIAKSLKDQTSYKKGVTGKKTSVSNEKATKRNPEQNTEHWATLQVKKRTLSLEEAEKVVSDYVPTVKEYTSVPQALQELHDKIYKLDRKLGKQYMDSKYQKDELGAYIFPEDDDLDFELPEISLEDYLRLKFPDASEKELRLDRADNQGNVLKAFEFDKQCAHCSGLNECPFNRKYGRPVVMLKYGKLCTGYTTTTPCRYDVAKPDPALERHIKRSGLTEFQVKQTFAAYKNNSAETTVVKAKSILAVKNKTSLVLAGKPGTGKTHLAIAIAMDAIQNGRQAIIITVPDLIGELREADWSHTDFFGVMRKFREVDCLVLDDWGKEKTTEKGMEYLYQIIDSRYRNGRQTIVTTNFLNPAELGDVEKIEPLLSRLLENGEWVSIRETENYRLKAEPEVVSEPMAITEMSTEVEAVTEPEILTERPPELEVTAEPENEPEPVSIAKTEVTTEVSRIISGVRDEDGFVSVSSLFGGKSEKTPEPEVMVAPTNVAESTPEAPKPEEPAPEAPEDIYHYFPTYDNLSNSDKKECVDWLARERPMIDKLKAQEDKSQSDFLQRYCPNYRQWNPYDLDKIRLWIVENHKWLMLMVQSPAQETLSTPETSEAPVTSENSSSSSFADNDDLWEEDEDEYRLYGDTGIPGRDYPIDEDTERIDS